MTISSTTRKTALFTGNGSTTSYAFTFKVQDSDDVIVYMLEDDVETAITTGFTVTLNANQNTNPGGSVLFDTAPTADQTFLITTDADPTQEQDVQNQSAFNPAIVMEALDKLTILVQQLAGKASRALKLRITDTSDNDDLVPETGKALGWGASGWTWLSDLATATVSSFMETPLVSASAHAFAKATDGSLTVTTYAALRALSGKASNVTYKVRGRASDRDGGEGDFIFVAGGSPVEDSGTVLVDTSGGGGACYRINFTAYDPLWFESATNFGAALNLAIAAIPTGGGVIRPRPRAAIAWTDAQVVCDKTNVVFDFRGNILNPQYDTAGASPFVLGNGTTTRQNIAILGGFWGPSNTAADAYWFDVRGVRGLVIDGVRALDCYGGFKFNASVTKSSSWVYHVNSEWAMKATGHVDFYQGDGLAAELYEDTISIESDAAPADAAVLRVTSAQSADTGGKIDRVCRDNSIWNGFTRGLYLQQGRIVNYSETPTCRYDEMVEGGVEIVVSGSATNQGIESALFRGRFGAGKFAIKMTLGSNPNTTSSIDIDITSELMTETAVKIAASGAGKIDELTLGVTSNRGLPSGANFRIIDLSGNINGTIHRCVGRTSTGTWDYALYNDTPTTARMRIGHQVQSNATLQVYDPNIGDFSIGRFCALHPNGLPRAQHRFPFWAIDITAGGTAVAMSASPAGHTTHVAPARGRWVKGAYNLRGTVSTNTLVVGPSASGAINTDLDKSFSSADGADPRAVVTFLAGSAEFAEGAALSMLYTSHGSLTPSGSLDLHADGYFQEM